MSFEVDSSPQPPDKSPASPHLEFDLWCLKQSPGETIRIYDLWNCEKTHCSCFKPLTFHHLLCSSRKWILHLKQVVLYGLKCQRGSIPAFNTSECQDIFTHNTLTLLLFYFKQIGSLRHYRKGYKLFPLNVSVVKIYSITFFIHKGSCTSNHMLR